MIKPLANIIRKVLNFISEIPHILSTNSLKEVKAMADRRAGKVPHVPETGGGKQPRSRNKDGSWRKKRSDAGKKR